ncbi:MAG: transcriptional regulator [Alphaproteobacteria bacterium]|nr:transcriptional regulator [Alphaproteobacteria bacterium]
MVTVNPIRTEQDYESALEEIGRLLEAAPGTPEFDRLDVLSTLVEAYEAVHYPMEPPDPIELIKFVLGQREA